MTDAIWNGTHILSEILNDLTGMFYRCRYDKFWTMMYVTDGCQGLTGYETDDLLYNKAIPYSALIHPDDLTRVNQYCDEQISRKETIDCRYRLIDKHGLIKQVRERAAAIYDEAGNVLFIEGYIVDIDELKERQELSRELRFYKHAIDLHMICSVTDRHGKIIFANQKFCEISRYSEKELIGADHNIVNSGFHSKEFFADLWKTITSKKVWHGEILNRAKDGSHYWVDTVIIPISNNRGKIIRYFSIRMDITERKLAEEKNRQHIRAMEKMLYMISHELRQPVATALGLIGLLNPGSGLNEEELNIAMEEVKMKVMEIELFTRKLTNYIHEHKILRE